MSSKAGRAVDNDDYAASIEKRSMSRSATPMCCPVRGCASSAAWLPT